MVYLLIFVDDIKDDFYKEYQSLNYHRRLRFLYKFDHLIFDHHYNPEFYFLIIYNLCILHLQNHFRN
jgi:hypothetical protein